MEISLANRDAIVALLREGICPLCGGKYVNPLLHISKKHGIKPREIREALLIKVKTSFVSQELREAMSNNAIKRNAVLPMHNADKKEYPKPTKLKTIAAQENGKHINNKKAIKRISPDGEIKIYKSMLEAGKDNNIDYSTISHCIRENRLDKRKNRWALS